MSGNQRNSRRKEMWVSHNRVLVGGNKKNVRNPNFDTEETKLLISLWGNPSIQKTLITSHKKFPIITKLSLAMRQYGYQRTPEEINTRLKNLKCLYNRLKKDVECGIRSHPTWKHFAAMDAILTRPIFGYQTNGDNLDENGLPEDDPTAALLLKEEDDVELDDEDGLRPEDLLQVETTREEHTQQGDDDVVIKDEPIDVDEYDKRNDKEQLQDQRNINMPKLIPRSSWLNNTSAPREQNPPPLRSSSHKIATRQSSVICVSSPRTISTTVTSTTSSNNINSNIAQSKGKISLVPTNLLLNQQQQSAGGKNYIVSNNGNNLSTITTTTINQNPTVAGDHNNSTMPMKVLLVNTMPKPAQPPNPASIANKAEIIPIPMDSKIQPKFLAGTNPLTSPKIATGAAQPDQRPRLGQRVVKRRRPRTDQTLVIPGMKTIISNLIRTQQETNALVRQRLELDTTQFNYHRKIFDELLGLVPILKGIGTQFLLASSNQHQQPSSSSTLNCNGHDEEVVVEEDEDEEEEEEEVSDT